MKLQVASLSMQSHNNAHTLKNTPTNGNLEKVNRQNGGNISLSKKSQYSDLIEHIQEQIQKVQENERYDTDTKESKVKELEKQLEELEKAMSNQVSEVLLQNNIEKFENRNASNSNNKTNKNTGSGDILEISLDAQALLQADHSVKKMKNAQSTKVKLEGQSNVLASEIKIDKGRGLDTTKQEEELERLKEGVEKSLFTIGDSIKEANKAFQNIDKDSPVTNTISDADKNDYEVAVDRSSSIAVESSISSKKIERQA